MQEKKQEKENTGDKINDFIQRNRKAIFSITGIIIILFIGAVVLLSVRESMDKKATEGLEELTDKFKELKENINDEDRKEEVDTFISELEAFAVKTKRFAGSKAWSMAAEIHAGREDWALAEEAFISSARAGEKTYLGPLSLFNAAAAAEEQGNFEQAIDLLKQCLSSKIEFPQAPRAQFAIGRLNEKLGNFPDALEAYGVIMSNWPDMPVWQQFARDRIIAIEIQ